MPDGISRSFWRSISTPSLAQLRQHMSGGPGFTITELAPFLIEPRFVTRVWGYQDLRPWYDRVAGQGNGSAAGSGEPIGEVWLTGDECHVATGSHSGKTLGE